MHSMMRRRQVSAAAALAIVAAAVVGIQAAETFTATAAVSSPKGKAAAPVTISVDRFVSDADRDQVMTAVKTNDQDAIQKALAKLPDVGFIELAGRRTPIKYAYARPTGAGRLVTVVTAEPILFLGGAAPKAKPREGFNVAFALLVLDASSAGDGELAPAAKLKVDTAGAIVTEGYNTETIRLTKIARAK